MAVERHRILALITPVIEGMGYILWHLEICGIGSQGIMIRIYIDGSEENGGEGITLDDCEKVSRQVGALLDVEDVISGNYTLEVSSCGLNRGLFTLKHYEHYVNHMVELFLFKKYEGCKRHIGRLLVVDDDTVRLRVANGDVDFKISDISKAKLISDF